MDTICFTNFLCAFTVLRPILIPKGLSIMRVHTTPIPFDSTREFHLSPLRALCHRKIVGYVVRHKPTGKLFLGRGSNPEGSFIQWQQRLAGLNAGDNKMSVAFRAIYTRRVDFEFEVVHLFDNTNEAQAWVDKTEADIRAQFGRQYCLNVSKAREDQQFWIQLVPLAERDMRFGGMGNKLNQRVKRSREAARAERDVSKALRHEGMEQARGYVRGLMQDIRSRQGGGASEAQPGDEVDE